MPDPAQLLQVFFILAASTIIFFNYIPAVREHLINYGPRTAAPAKPAKSAQSKQTPRTSLQGLLGSIAAFQVPHDYFGHFYIVSVASSLFWAIQLLLNASLLQRTCTSVHQTPNACMSMERIELTWVLMGIQGVRRQLETAMFSKSSTSQMWFVHYLVGIAFYLAMGIAVWIEGAGIVFYLTPTARIFLNGKAGTLTSTSTTRSAVTYSAPSPRTILSIPIFILASGMQNDCHTYLASLKKYTLPVHPIFTLLICPHYTAECLIYLSLALVSAPQGAWVNRTMFAGFLFVFANLSVTACGTKAWYENKFGKEAVKGRWTMIPFVW